MTGRRLDLLGDAGATADPELPAWMAFESEFADDAPRPAGGSVYGVAGVRVDLRVIDHDAGDAVYGRGDEVVCTAGSGVVRGVVAVPSRRALVTGPPLPRILRLASERDRAGEAQLRAREQAVLLATRRAAQALSLDAKLVRAEATNGGQRFFVYFASEDKFSLHDLLAALARETEERIELRHVGARDAAKVIGGVGPCGLQLCCNTFLSDFAPVTIKMAKDQGLGVNPQKLSGVCGRLLCCLVYEEAFYRAQRSLVPRVGDRVGTDRGQGRVREVDVLELVVKVVLDSGECVTRKVSELVRP